MAANNIGLFGMINAGYNVVGTGFSALENIASAANSLSMVAKMKADGYLAEEQILQEEKLALLKFKAEATRARIAADQAKLTVDAQ